MLKKRGGCEDLERPNVERSIFRNFEISIIKMTKDELFHFLFSNLFIFICLNYLNTQKI